MEKLFDICQKYEKERSFYQNETVKKSASNKVEYLFIRLFSLFLQRIYYKNKDYGLF